MTIQKPKVACNWCGTAVENPHAWMFITYYRHPIPFAAEAHACPECWIKIQPTVPGDDSRPADPAQGPAG